MPKRYKTKLRFKRKKEIYKKTVFFLVLLAILSFSPYLYSYVRGFLSNIRSNHSSKIINSIKIDFEENFITIQLTEFLKNKIGSNFNEKVKSEIESYINSKWPYISGLVVEYKNFSGTLYITGKVEKVLALCYCGDEKKYVLESGNIIKNIDFGENFLKIRLNPCRRNVSNEIVLLIRDFEKMKSKVPFRFKEIFFNEKDEIEVLTEDGNIILWGSTNFTEEKILKLGEILKDAADKISFPVKVDLRYFEKGKAFLSPKA